MDSDELRSILINSGVDVWTLIDTAIKVASQDYKHEIVNRRDGIVQRLYASPCENCSQEEPVKIKKEVVEEEKEESEGGKEGSPPTPQWVSNEEEEEEEEEERTTPPSRDEKQIKIILDIRRHLENPYQSEENVMSMLQELEDMDITFKALRETDIGRQINLMKKHPSEEVCRIVKRVVRKWKELVDAWVKGTSPNADGDSPQQNPPRNTQNGHHQVPDFKHSPSPNTRNGSSGSEKNHSEPEPRRKLISKREPEIKPHHSPQVSSSRALPNKPREPKDTTIDQEKLASARKRLQNNYQEAQNAKKQRTIQVMDIHDIPKPKNSFFSKNKGGSQGRHW